MASITPHADGWRAQVRKSGVRKSRVFKTKAEAKLWASRLELEIESGKADTGHTFEQAVKRYMKEVSENKRGKRWEVLRLQALMQCPEFDRKLSKINQSHVAAWRDRRATEVKSSTILRELTLLRHLLNVARDEWRWTTSDPIKGVRMPKHEPPRVTIWGWREIRQVLRADAGPKTGEVIAAFHIALRTGMRLSEVLVAPLHFDPKRRVVTLPKSKTDPRPVEVPVGRIASRLLQRPPFTVGPNEASTLFKRLTRSLGLDGLTFHDTRATAITHLSRRLEPMDLAKVSRHKNLSLLLNTYYRPKIEDIAARI